MRPSDARLDATSSTSEQSARPKSWPDWAGETVLCVASGPSLTAAQIETVRRHRERCRIIAVCDIGLEQRLPIALPDCDLWYAADDTFWQYYEDEALASRAIRVSAYPPTHLWHLHMNTKHREFIWTPGECVSGGHSGFQALQIAISAGADRVALLGYDCKPRGIATNSFGRKPAKLHRNSTYAQWPEWYAKLRRALPRPVEIVNCSEGSAVTAFPFDSVEEFLCR